MSVKRIITSLGNGMSPIRHQGVTWTNADLLSNKYIWEYISMKLKYISKKLEYIVNEIKVYFNEIKLKIRAFSLRKCLQNFC